jgi:hypothetical protein
MLIPSAFGQSLSVDASSVDASKPPRFDVRAHCREVASFGGSYSAVLDKRCSDLEQTAYDNLLPIWAQLPIEMKKHCTEVARVRRSGSYSLLEGCVSLEINAASARARSTFRY